MATQLFFRSGTTGGGEEGHLGTNNPKLNSATSGWASRALATTRGSGVTTAGGATVTGATPGVEVIFSAIPAEWLSPPLAQDVTISGAITGNLWASESNMSANVAINFRVDRVDAATGAIEQIAQSVRTTELAVTTRAVNNFTVTPAVGIACKRGDRLRVRVFGDDAGTMATGFTFDFSCSWWWKRLKWRVWDGFPPWYRLGPPRRGR